MCASFFSRFTRPKPNIVESPPPPSITHGAGMQIPEYKNKPYFLVASVEMGNTTTKCILTGVSLETGMLYVINKTVSMSRDIRPPKPNETVFGATLDGTPLTREAVTELVRDTLIQCHREVHLDIQKDLDFVVRRPAWLRRWNPRPDRGFCDRPCQWLPCSRVPPRKMTPPMSKENQPEKLQPFSFADKVVFVGAVAGVIPPVGSTGVEMVANEMEGELAMAGIKEGAKWTGVDFRNPCISVDFGTTLDGRITTDVSPESPNPFARTVGNFCGLAGAIPDAIVRGTGLVQARTGTALDIFGEHSVAGGLFGGGNRKVVADYVDRCHEHIDIRIVPADRDRSAVFRSTPASLWSPGSAMIGCDCGTNSSDMDKLLAIGAEIHKNHGMSTLNEVIDRVCARMALRLIDVAVEKELVPKNASIGFTGRAAISGRKPEYILEGITERNLFDNPNDHLVFVDDGLARRGAHGQVHELAWKT